MSQAKYDLLYRYVPNRFGWKYHHYQVVGRDGAVHFHVSENMRPLMEGLPRFSGGLEAHHRSCPPYRNDPPDHKNCEVLGGNCWHDGTSLYASEVLIPRWERDFPDHDAVFVWLTGEYVQRFDSEASA